ncbi:MAG: GntR family transcriptional regulator [Tetrasphaera sp.]
MSLEIGVDLRDPTPPYEQLRRQLAGLIAAGQLHAGDRLPPVRQLAKDLDLANGTVARAYGELESSGLVSTRRGGGTTVADRPPNAAAAERLRLDAAARTFTEAVRALGLAQEDAHEALARVWR